MAKKKKDETPETGKSPEEVVGKSLADSTQLEVPKVETPETPEVETPKRVEPAQIPEPVVMIKQGDFEFRATLTGVKTESTKEGLRKVVTLKSSNLQTLRDIDQYLEKDFSVRVNLTFGHFIRPEPQKGEVQQQLPLDADESHDTSGDKSDSTEVEQQADVESGPSPEPEQQTDSEDSTQGDIPTEYICEPCSKTEGKEVALVTVKGNIAFLQCPVCKKVFANPDAPEPEA